MRVSAAEAPRLSALLSGATARAPPRASAPTPPRVAGCTPCRRAHCRAAARSTARGTGTAGRRQQGSCQRSAVCSAAASPPVPADAAGAEREVYGQLRRIVDPDFGADIVECGFVKGLTADTATGLVAFTLELTTPVCMSPWSAASSLPACLPPTLSSCVPYLDSLFTPRGASPALRRARSRTSSSARRRSMWAHSPGSPR
jgi:hypothetical protein